VDAARGANLISVVCTFDPHTRVFLRPDRPPRLLETLAQRIDAIERLGVDVAVIIPFVREVARQPRDEFVRRFLVASLHARQLHVSKDFTFGAGGRGNADYLREIAPQYGFEVHVVPAVMAAGEPISSTRIRDALAAGRVEEAAELLGRPFTLRGEVVHGAGRGRALDAPTANLDVDDRFLPAKGVYVTEVRVDSEAYPAVTNVGVRPTFGDEGSLTVETHLLSGGRALYGKEMSLAFLERLRDEMRFDGPAELAEQIRRDVAAATRYFEQRGQRC
jgi:riboflavin kinase/FMN adenylyltransferase